MTAPVFVDANVFVYARDPSDPLKRSVAAEWLERVWADRRGRTSMQALNECYSVLTRKLRPTMAREDAWRYILSLMTWDPCPVDAEMARHAREIELRYRLSWWDSLIVAAAQLQGCGLLLTEDLDEQGVYAGVRVCNPFRLALSEAA
jgi:predicted nucleic acid-binding protein